MNASEITVLHRLRHAGWTPPGDVVKQPLDHLFIAGLIGSGFVKYSHWRKKIKITRKGKHILKECV